MTLHRHVRGGLCVAAALPLMGCFSRTTFWLEDAGRSCAVQFESACVDATFGQGGLFALDVGAVDNVAGVCQPMDIQPDGRIVMGGMAGPATDSALVAVRLDHDGNLDPAFGEAGVAWVDLDAWNDETKVVRALADGRLLLAGLRTQPSGAPTTTGAARLLPSGLLDAEFGDAGIELFDEGSDIDIANGAVVLGDGALRLAGQWRPNATSTCDLRVRGLLADGAPDPSFGAGVPVAIDWFGFDEFGGCVVAGPAGTLLVPGETYHGALSFDFAVARVLADGSLDPTFADTNNLPGRIATDFFGNADFCIAIALQSDGKIVCGGYATGPDGRHFALARYMPSGALDTAFADQGTLVIAMGTDDRISAIVSVPDGRLVCGGDGLNAQGDRDFAVAVLSRDGVLDESFGVGGKALLDLSAGYDDAIRAMAVDSLGRLVAFGETSNGANNDFAVIRLLL
ncbi:MAG: hypothetical protein AAB426_10760 [Myxococcota bacterium]